MASVIRSTIEPQNCGCAGYNNPTWLYIDKNKSK